jgi:hypothetical protein
MTFHDKAIAQRSYFIWQREGCPDGKAVDHWLMAISELEAELGVPVSDPDDVALRILPRPRISRPPHRVVARRISRKPAAVSAAKR